MMKGSTFAIATLSIVAQILGVFLMPRAHGFTKLGPTLLLVLCYIVGIGAMVRLVYRGVNLGILVPIMAAVIPLVSIFIGIVAYGETASPLKIGLLVGACIAIGVASL